MGGGRAQGASDPQWSVSQRLRHCYDREAFESCGLFKGVETEKCELELNHTALTLLPTPEVSLIIPLWVLFLKPHKTVLPSHWCPLDDLFDLDLITSLPVQECLSEAYVDMISSSPKSETFAYNNFILFFDFFSPLA